MSVKIQVTKSDIEDAEQGDVNACMVWQAVTRNLQLETETGSASVIVSVDYEKIRFYGRKTKKVVNVRIPDEVGHRIKNWDVSKRSVKPFEFDLNLPDDWRERVQGISE